MISIIGIIICSFLYCLNSWLRDIIFMNECIPNLLPLYEIIVDYNNFYGFLQICITSLKIKKIYHTYDMKIEYTNQFWTSYSKLAPITVWIKFDRFILGYCEHKGLVLTWLLWFELRFAAIAWVRLNRLMPVFFLTYGPHLIKLFLHVLTGLKAFFPSWPFHKQIYTVHCL